MNKFVKGVLAGVTSTVAVSVAGALAAKKKFIDPELEKEEFINENRKKAARRRISR
ncbi:DUF3042 family protein [Streptococcaceae bacterium ESL0687]|nr:DUF3042 family protein [Streptococcaceae bacterium ESL0687]